MASTYTIKKGDTLDSVAQQLGTTANQLAGANNIQNGQVSEGQVLNLPSAHVASEPTQQAATSAAKPAQTPSPYTGLNGLTENTAQKLGQYSQGYQQSESVAAAQNYLNGVLSGKPGAYQNQYQNQLQQLYDQVMNRDPFTFNLNGDALYNMYKDQYKNLGRQAMMDTMGQAAAATGGYGNSYAQTAGQQAYQKYLTQLNNVVPELYKMAYERYQQEGSDLLNRLNLTQDLEQSEYGRYRDTVSDWNNERDFANSDYWAKYNADYTDYTNMLNYWNQMAQAENSQYNTNRQMAYSQAMAILQTGNMPSADLLSIAGISQADANSIKSAYTKKSSGGSSRRSSGGSSGSGNGGYEDLPYSSLSAEAKRLYDAAAKSGGTAGTKAHVADALSRGKITQAEASTILSSKGIR